MIFATCWLVPLDQDGIGPRVGVNWPGPGRSADKARSAMHVTACDC